VDKVPEGVPSYILPTGSGQWNSGDVYGVMRGIPLRALWCWDATTHAASDNTPSECRGWSGVLSLAFEVPACQGRVTLPCKSLRGVRAPNTLAFGFGSTPVEWPPPTQCAKTCTLCSREAPVRRTDSP